MCTIAIQICNFLKHYFKYHKRYFKKDQHLSWHFVYKVEYVAQFNNMIEKDMYNMKILLLPSKYEIIQFY